MTDKAGSTIYTDNTISLPAIVERARRGISAGEFGLAFQPILHARSGRLSGVECLLRWHHPKFGLLLPCAFHRALSDAALAREVFYFVFESACREFAAWDESFRKEALRISINIQPSVLLDDELGARIRRISQDHRVSPDRFDLEFVETEDASVLLSLKEFTEPLRRLGLRLKCDDFGSAYPPFAALAAMRIDGVKLDKAFLREIPASDRACVVLKSVLDLCAQLELSVVAEGVGNRRATRVDRHAWRYRRARFLHRTSAAGARECPAALDAGRARRRHGSSGLSGEGAGMIVVHVSAARAMLRPRRAWARCCVSLFAGLWCVGAHAVCAETGAGSGDGLWSPAQNYPIGPAAVAVYPQKFMPAGTVLFDQTYPMGYLIGNPEAVVAKCTDIASASTVSAALRLDDTYQYGSFLVGTTRYYFTQYVYPSQAPATMHTTVGWKLYGVMSDGSQREMVFNDSGAPTNTAVVFRSSGGYEASTRGDRRTYPYVVKAKHFPSVRLVLVRSPYDDNRFAVVSDGYIGRIGIAHTDYGGGSTDATYGYIRFGNYQPASSAACGVVNVPRTVDLGTHPTSTILSGSAPWVPFTVTYQCTSTNSPVGTLRVGLEPQNRANLVATDYRYLRPDAAATAASGAGVVYRRQGEAGQRFWVQNSACQGISTATQNNSNCYVARTQTQAQGWYQVNPASTGGSATPGYTDYTEPFEARIERLPGSGDATPGSVSATVNVLVNQP